MAEKQLPGKRLCGHSINDGGCHLGDTCPNYHAVDIKSAIAEYDRKKTLSLCRPDCSQDGCGLLHVLVTPLRTATTRQPPSGTTPARPEGSSSRSSGGRQRSAPRGRSNDSGPMFRELSHMQGKLYALHKAEVAYESLAQLFRTEDARTKAESAKQMQKGITNKLREFNLVIDSYIEILGLPTTEE